MEKEERLAEKLKKGSLSALEKIIDVYSGYVCTVIRNFARESLSESDISEYEIADNLRAEDQAELNRTTDCLNEGLKELSCRDREIFLIFYFYGEKSLEIAAKTGLSEGSVRSVLSRTRAKLKDYLTEKGFA